VSATPGTGERVRRPREGRPPVDPRLWRRIAPVRVWLASSVAIGLGLTGCLVAQAVFLAHLLARLFQPAAGLHDVLVDLVGLAVATLVRSVLLSAGATAGAGGASRVRGQLRRDALGRVLERGPVWLAKERTGELAVTLGRGLDALDAYVADYLPRLVLAVLAPLVLLGVIGALDWVSLLVLLAALGVVPVFMVLVGKLTAQRVAARWDALGALGAHFLDTVQGLPVLRAYGRARRQEAQIAAVTDDLRRTTLAVLREAFLSALVLETIAAVGTALVAVPLALRLIGGHMTLAPALTVLILTPEVFLPLRRASADFHAATEGLSALDRVFEVLGDDPPARQKQAARRARPAAQEPFGSDAAVVSGPRAGGLGEDGGAAPGVQRSALVVSGLSVAYPDRDRRALEGIDLVVEPGERVAIVGQSGAGKSSLLAAVLGLVPASAGSITLGGLVQGEVDPERWRECFAYLPQRPWLSSASLRDNLRLGHLTAPGDVDDARLAEALSIADLAELVARLPEGLGTPLGEGGARLSTGERQRVGLARALCRRSATVVVLDEPTSHLDAATEERVVAGLDGWLAGRSLLVASHRPRLLELADRVFTMERGRLAAATAGAAESPRSIGVRGVPPKVRVEAAP
jgi:ATP-binding cassette subfamily C protein CydD